MGVERGVFRPLQTEAPLQRPSSWEVVLARPCVWGERAAVCRSRGHGEEPRRGEMALRCPPQSGSRSSSPALPAGMVALGAEGVLGTPARMFFVPPQDSASS